MPELCSLTVEERDGVALAVLSGEIDLSNADELGGELRVRISNRVLAVIVDLSDVTYVDSYGLSCLFDLNRRLETRQQRLRVVIPEAGHLRRVLELVSFGAFAGIDPTVAEARAALARPRDSEELAQ